MNKATRSENFITPEFRGSFLHIFEPRKALEESAKAKYEVTMLFPKKSDKWYVDLPWLAKQIQKVLGERWPGGQGLPPLFQKPDSINNRAWPIKDGDAPNESGNFLEEHKGHWAVRASSTNFDANRNLLNGKDNSLGTLSPKTCFSGCYFEAQVNVFLWERTDGRGVSVGLENLKFTREGESFGGGGMSADEAWGVKATRSGTASGAGWGSGQDATEADDGGWLS
jgi:hypothetical protein